MCLLRKDPTFSMILLFWTLRLWRLPSFQLETLRGYFVINFVWTQLPWLLGSLFVYIFSYLPKKKKRHLVDAKHTIVINIYLLNTSGKVNKIWHLVKGLHIKKGEKKGKKKKTSLLCLIQKCDVPLIRKKNPIFLAR